MTRWQRAGHRWGVAQFKLGRRRAFHSKWRRGLSAHVFPGARQPHTSGRQPVDEVHFHLALSARTGRRTRFESGERPELSRGNADESLERVREMTWVGEACVRRDFGQGEVSSTLQELLRPGVVAELCPCDVDANASLILPHPSHKLLSSATSSD